MQPDMMPTKPMIHLTDKDLPEIKNWKVGETYEVIVKMKMNSKMDYKKELSAGFELVDILVPQDAQDVNEMDNEEFGNFVGEQKKKMYGK